MTIRSKRRRHLAIPVVALIAPLLAGPVDGLSDRQQPASGSLQSHLDTARLRSVRDSFAIYLQGKESGWQRLTATRTGSQWHVGDAVSLTGIVNQESVVTFDDALHELSLRQSGEMQAQPMEISLDMASGRVKGIARTPASASGPLAIDTAFTATTVDDNAVMPLMVGVHWRDSLSLSFPVLASGKGTTENWSVTVLGRDTTTVPAGHFETWRVEMKSGRNRSIFHVTRNAPYRMVRIANGPMFEMQLVK